MVEGLENLTERAMSESADHFISIRDGISSCNFGLTGTIGKVFDALNSSRANIKDLIAEDLFLFEGSQERIFFFFLILSDLDSATALIGRLMLNLVCILDELNR